MIKLCAVRKSFIKLFQKFGLISQYDSYYMSGECARKGGKKKGRIIIFYVKLKFLCYPFLDLKIFSPEEQFRIRIGIPLVSVFVPIWKFIGETISDKGWNSDSYPRNTLATRVRTLKNSKSYSIPAMYRFVSVTD
jgi:hypothetical protein